MKHRSRPAEQDDLLRPRLLDMIDGRHELVRLAALIDWSWFEREWAGFFPAQEGRPATHPRLVAGLMYLQHAYGLADEAVLARWVENPYFQHFTGEVFFQHRPPIHPSSLSRWRVRIGEEGVEWLLTKTIEAGRASGAVTPRSLSEIAVDTTVMEKAIAYPTDSRLYERARRSLVALAGKAGITLRQNYNRKAPRLAAQAGRHAHARQFRHMRKVLRTLKGYTGRVLRDIGRKLGAVPEGPLRARIEQRLALVTRLLRQTPKSAGKIYALHEPEVDCISKGKARVRYEFGCKVSIATTLEGGFVVGMRSMPGNPYDGHTLADALQQVETLTGSCPSLAVVDRGYRGHRVQGTRVLVSGTRRGLTPKLAKLLRRRSAIEPEIGHMKSDGRLARCALKDTIGDALFAVLCGCGHNIRKILAHRFCCIVCGSRRSQPCWDMARRRLATLRADLTFKGRQFTAEVILWAVRWYLMFPISYRDLELMLQDRGVAIAHTTIFRWVQAYAPELERRLRPYLRMSNGSWRVDETYVRVKGRWMYLYRAVDSRGQTIDFLLSAKRDAKAAKRFFRKALRQPHTVNPRTITVDKNPAYPCATAEMKADDELWRFARLRQCKFLNNIVEQDHRRMKRLVRPGLGFGGFDTARRTLAGYEAMAMLRKEQVHEVGGRDMRAQASCVAELFQVAA